MADNTVIDPGAGGDTIATDDVGGIKYQRVKVVWGADGVASDVASAAALPVSNSSLNTLAGAVTSTGMLITSTELTEMAGDLSTMAAGVSGTEFQVDVVAALPAGDNNIGNVDIASAIPAGDNNIGNVDIASAIPAGTNNIGDVDVLTIAAGATLIGDVGLSGARTSGGTTLYKNIDVDESEDQIKGGAGQIYWMHAINTSSALLYLKFYNVLAASVTVGTTVPDLTFAVPHNSGNGGGYTLPIPNGIEFSTAITVACTTGVADNDAGAPGANALILNLGYA